MLSLHRTGRPLVVAACVLTLAAGALHLPHPHAAGTDAVQLAPQAQTVVAEPAEPVLKARFVVPPHHASRSRTRSSAIPVGDLRGWKQVLREDFLGARLPRGWSAYSGRPGGNGNGWWAPDHASVRGDDLHLVGDWDRGTFVTGGVMATRHASTYGKYEVRFKVSRAHGVKYALLLWPASGRWPSAGEIDFAEDGGGARRRTAATLHYGASNRQVQKHVTADFTQFQTVGVEWTPARIVYTLNGKPWATVTGSHVPRGPMRLALQLEAGAGTSWAPAPTRRTTPRTADLVVDWVVGYRRA